MPLSKNDLAAIGRGNPPANFMNIVNDAMAGKTDGLAELLGAIDIQMEKEVRKVGPITMSDGTVLSPRV